MRDKMTEQQLRQTDPQELLDLLHDLSSFEHTLLYYGPMSEKEVNNIVSATHKMPKKLQPVKKGQRYEQQPTPENEIWLAPYDAKNIYMRMYHNELKPWSIEDAATITLLNEYFGGGMNSIVFQELREARGLAYSASAYYQFAQPVRTNLPESYYTNIITQNDKMMDCIKQFYAILDTMPQSQTAFDIAKDAVLKTLASQRTTKMDVLYAYQRAQWRNMDYDINERIYNDVSQLTLQDIVRFEQENMANKTYLYLILGDEKNLDIKALEQIAPIRRLTTEEIFGY